MVGSGKGWRRDHSDRGQATVEFALILPLLVLCIAGLVWVGQLMTMQLRIEHAAREGARAAAVEPSAAASVASAAVGSAVPHADVVAVVGPEFVEVTVRVEVGGVPIIGVGARTLEADVVMRREDLHDLP